MGESVSLPLTPPPPRLVDKSNSLMESDELKRRVSGTLAATGWTGKGNGLDFVR